MSFYASSASVYNRSSQQNCQILDLQKWGQRDQTHMFQPESWALMDMQPQNTSQQVGLANLMCTYFLACLLLP